VLGVYVVVDTPLPALGDTFHLSFALPGDDVWVQCQARVAWRNPPSIFKGCGASAAGLPPGCGLEFVDLAPADRERIEARVSAGVRR
jgi:hypothetical protein